MIEIRELVKTFDGFAALDGASLTVPQGRDLRSRGAERRGQIHAAAPPDRRIPAGLRHRLGGRQTYGRTWRSSSASPPSPTTGTIFMQSSIRDMMKFYRGFYPQFNMERYEKLRGVFSLDESSSSAVFPRECRSRRRSGSPCAVCRTISFWMSRWTASTP